jgi:hypothetical protein
LRLLFLLYFIKVALSYVLVSMRQRNLLKSQSTQRQLNSMSNLISPSKAPDSKKKEGELVRKLDISTMLTFVLLGLDHLLFLSYRAISEYQ